MSLLPQYNGTSTRPEVCPLYRGLSIREVLLYNSSSHSAGTNGELLVSITLLVPAHTLLHYLPPSPSHKVSITFAKTHDPTQPLKAIFGSSKLPRSSELRHVKRSVAMVPVRLNPNFKGMKETTDISPIEPSRNSPMVCGRGSTIIPILLWHFDC